jgi:peptide/nickel transport system permease protein
LPTNAGFVIGRGKGRLPIPAAVALAAVMTLAVMALGGVPLLLGLILTLGVALLAMPSGPRRYLVRRAGRVAATLGMTMAVVWLLVHNYPDAARQTPTGLVPAMERYISWFGKMLLGDLGPSSYSETVTEGVGRTIPISFQLVVYSQILAAAIALPGALYGARLQGRAVDVAFRALGLAGLAVPVFVIGPILMYALGVGEIGLFGLSFGIKLFPTGRYVPLGEGLGPHLRSMAMPSITLGLSTAAAYLVLLRAEILQQLRSEHVSLARSKGLPPGRIVRVHALRPAAPSVVAAVAAQSSLLLGNLVIIERIFTLPGFGDYVLVAIGRRDDLAVVGGLFVAAAILAVINLFADALLLVVDPRLEP